MQEAHRARQDDAVDMAADQHGHAHGDRQQRAPAQRREPAAAKPANFDDVPFDDDIPF